MYKYVKFIYNIFKIQIIQIKKLINSNPNFQLEKIQLDWYESDLVHIGLDFFVISL